MSRRRRSFSSAPSVSARSTGRPEPPAALTSKFETESGGRIYAGQMESEGCSGMVYVLVRDVYAHHDRAKAEGAEIFEELFDTSFGHRRYSCADPQGQRWSFATPLT